MATPFIHPGNRKTYYGNVGRGSKRRLKNLKVPVSEPIARAQEVLDRLNREWEEKHGTPGAGKPKSAPEQRTLLDLFREYKELKDIHYRKSRRGFGDAAARVEKIIKACGFKYPADINGQAVLTFIDGLLGPNFSASTAEHYRRDFKWFCNWLLEHGHISRKVFGRRDRFRGKLHHQRRVLSGPEQKRLLAAAQAGRVYGKQFKISGPERRLVYWTALKTGFRSGELQALTVSSLRGDRLFLSGEFTKNGDEADQLIPPALAAALAQHAAGRAPAEPLFHRWGRGADMIMVDLKAAGIEYSTADGLADFHALRHTYCTDLIANGTDISTAQKLMRHRNVAMTMSYAKTDDKRKAEAVSRLDADSAELPGSFAPAVIDVSKSQSVLVRLFGTDDVADLELLGAVEVDAVGNVLLAVGPNSGTVLTSVADEPGNRDGITDSTEGELTQVLGTIGAGENRTLASLIKSQVRYRYATAPKTAVRRL